MLTSLEGKSALVTGASKGIGKGIARVFARHGARVLVVARHLDAAEATADEIRKAGGKAAAFAAEHDELVRRNLSRVSRDDYVKINMARIAAQS